MSTQNTGTEVTGGRARDFVARYLAVSPSHSISGEEALAFYDAAIGGLQSHEFERAAEAAFARLEPDRRLELAHRLQQRASSEGFEFPELSSANEPQFRDATQLARIVSSIERKQPGCLRRLLTGERGGAHSGLTQEPWGVLDRHLFQATLGGIAAYALASRLGIDVREVPPALPH